jgi:hypothetical protein
LKSFLVFFFIIITSTRNFSQTKTDWFPSELNIQPFTANFLEPRAGFQYLFDMEKVQINIGTSHDIVQFNSDENIFSVGADFFTYTRARKEENFKFPVETIDYLFGINTGFKTSSENSEFGVRLRFSHISAHLADGLYKSDSNQWLNNQGPFTYSREFFELLAYYKLSGIRIYAGGEINIHTIPSEIKKTGLQIGFDYYISQFSTNSFTPFLAYDFKLRGYDQYYGCNSFSAGLKFGSPESRGFSIFAGYFSGKSNHGEFYFLSEDFLTIGINLDI